MMIGELEKLKNIRTSLSETRVSLILENSETRDCEINGWFELISSEVVSSQQCIKFLTHISMNKNEQEEENLKEQ